MSKVILWSKEKEKSKKLAHAIELALPNIKKTKVKSNNCINISLK